MAWPSPCTPGSLCFAKSFGQCCRKTYWLNSHLYTRFPLFCQKFWSMLPKNLTIQLSPSTPGSLSFAKSFGQCCQKPNDWTLTLYTWSPLFCQKFWSMFPKWPNSHLYTRFPLICQKVWSMLPKNLMTQLSPVHPVPSLLPKALVNVARNLMTQLSPVQPFPSLLCHAQLLAVTIRVIWLVGFQLRLFSPCLVQ